MFEESLLRTVAGFLARSERLALQPFEERAAGGRDIGEPPGRAGGIERRDRVTAACDRNNLPGGGEFRRGFGDDVQDHLVATHAVHRDHARRRVRRCLPCSRPKG